MNRPTNITMGLDSTNLVKISNVNVFSSSLSVERMEEWTTAGEEECGAPGDHVSWDETEVGAALTEWSINYGPYKVIEVDREWDGPCRRESKVHAFFHEDQKVPYMTRGLWGFDYHRDCMLHCQKIGAGRSPPLDTEEEWQNFKTEVNLIAKLRYKVNHMWLSATEGDKNNKLDRLDHWPETELVNNQTEKLEAVEAVWRDFYTGQRLDNWTNDADDGSWVGETRNCMLLNPDWDTVLFWYEWECITHDSSCPCSYPAQPLLRLRGLSAAGLIDDLFTPKQLPANPGSIILLGDWSTRIEYNEISSQWVPTDLKSNVKAVSKATQLSYLLGKHKWTISKV